MRKIVMIAVMAIMTGCGQKETHHSKHPDPLGWQHHMAVIHKDSIKAVYDVYSDSVMYILNYRADLFLEQLGCRDMECFNKIDRKIKATNITKWRVCQISDSLWISLSAAHDSILATHRHTL